MRGSREPHFSRAGAATLNSVLILVTTGEMISWLLVPTNTPAFDRRLHNISGEFLSHILEAGIHRNPQLSRQSIAPMIRQAPIRKVQKKMGVN